MCLLWGTNWVFISQKTTFFIVTAVKTSNLTNHVVLIINMHLLYHSYTHLSLIFFPWNKISHLIYLKINGSCTVCLFSAFICFGFKRFIFKHAMLLQNYTNHSDRIFVLNLSQTFLNKKNYFINFSIFQLTLELYQIFYIQNSYHHTEQIPICQLSHCS
jgi:hypothetical protein